MISSLLLLLATPYLISEVIDVGLSSGQISILLFLGGLLILASVFRGAASYMQTYIAESLAQRITYRLRRQLQERVQSLSFAYHDKSQTGNLMSRGTTDIEAIRFFINMGSLRLVYNILLLFAAFVWLLVVNWQLALVAFSVLPLAAYRTVLVGNRLRPIWLSIQRGTGELGTILQENLAGARVVKAFRRGRAETEKFGAVAKRVQERNLKANRENALNQPLQTFFMNIATAAVLWFGGVQVINGTLDLGDLVAFVALLFLLNMPVRSIGFLVNLFARGISAAERVFEILDATSPVVDRPDARPLLKPRGEVTFDRVSFSYDAASPVLRDVSFNVEPGQLVALLGSTGSGKSTIVNLIPRFYDITGGVIQIDGQDIRDYTVASLRSHIGIVLQDSFLFTMNIARNIAYGTNDISQEEIERAAKIAHIHDFISSLPDGYETQVGERGVTLSGGQRQRIAIARTVLLDPRILILDDATSSVDMETEYQIQQALSIIMKGRTTFIIAQRLRTVRSADKILMLGDGAVVAAGNHDDLLRSSEAYQELYDLQLRDQEEAHEKATAI